VILAIRKASPALLLVGSGVPGGERWIPNHARELNPGISIWVDNCFEIFAGKAKRPRRELFDSGLESLPGILTRPWRWLKLLSFVYFKFLVIAYRLMGR
jgi:N-acetylglucosaminyldiphosphoundecaprenol N-acetyl-beta-D-mannosaminyltransferase